MNRFARVLVSVASIAGALAAVPSLAQAQTLNVAPPAYGARAPSYPVPVAPGARPVVAPFVRPARSAPFARVTAAEAREHARDEWIRMHDHARSERQQREHARECERAYERGASPRVLGQMRCGY
jgi:hypothetical protein